MNSFLGSVSWCIVACAVIAWQSTASEVGFGTAEADKFIGNIGASDSQRRSLSAAFERNAMELAALDEQFSAKLDAAEKEGRRAYMPMWAEWRRQRLRLLEEHENRIEHMLEAGQKKDWGIFAMEARRNRVVQDMATQIGLRASELDVEGILRECDIDTDVNVEFGRILAEYRVKLDQELREWDRQFTELAAAIEKSTDAKEQERLSAKVDERFQRCRSLANAAISEIMVNADGDVRHCVSAKFTCVHRPEFCKPTPVDLLMESLRGWKRLTPEQYVAAEQIHEQYLARFVLEREELLDAVLRWDKTSTASKRAARYQELLDRRENPLHAWIGHSGLEHLETMHELQWRTCARLRALLDTSQLADLPPAIDYLFTLSGVQNE